MRVAKGQGPVCAPSRRRPIAYAACGASLLLAMAAPLHAGWNGMTRVITGVGGTTVMAQAPGDPDRLFIGMKEGLIRILNLNTGRLEQNFFMDLVNEVDPAGEGGLAGMVFDPDYQTNGKFYLTLTADNGGIEIAPATETTPAVLSPYSVELREYRVSNNPNVADQSSFRPILDWVKPYDFHNSGWIAFGPDDGHLYITTGDGGGVYDSWPGHTPGIGNAQDLTDNWMGKVLRVDLGGDDFPDDPTRNYAIPAYNPFVGVEGDDEIFAYGLRNPWRASFDRETGDLWIADVGEQDREEINVIPAGSAGGQNFGWRRREGADPTPEEGIGGSPPPRNVHPVYDYAHLGKGGDPALQGNSVIGGYVYRGDDPELQGQYVFSDFVGRKVWMFDPADPYGTVTNVTSQLRPDQGNLAGITTMFEDAAGRLYIATLNGDVFRLETGGQELGLPGDFSGDGFVDANDLPIWMNAFGTEGTDRWRPGDGDGDGDVDGQDFLVWQQNLNGNEPIPPRVAASGLPVPEPATLGLIAAAAMFPFVRRPRRW
jgi:glucose/arabinose dehydrogenase